MKKHNDNCVVCGARRTHYTSSATCDPICHRANAAGRTRGKQIRMELRAMLSWPWSTAEPVSPFEYDPSNNYNQPSEVNT